MTQRILIPTPGLRPAVAHATRREPRWVSFGEAVGAVLDSILAWRPASREPLPPEVLLDHDPALHQALTGAGVERERERLAANRQALLY